MGDFDGSSLKINCKDPVSAGSVVCQILTSSPKSCDDSPSYAYKAVSKLKKGATHSALVHCIKIKPVKGKYRFSVEAIEPGAPCVIGETGNQAKAKRRRRLLQDDTGSSGC